DGEEEAHGVPEAGGGEEREAGGPAHGEVERVAGPGEAEERDGGGGEEVAHHSAAPSAGGRAAPGAGTHLTDTVHRAAFRSGVSVMLMVHVRSGMACACAEMARCAATDTASSADSAW